MADGHFKAVGSGGKRMQNAGLSPLVDFENLPVSGFGDVLPKYLKLRESFNQLKTALESPKCLGLIAVDYPGFNMKLVKRAGKLHKPVLYVAPPQVWAWKRKRAAELAKNPCAKLAVFFDFEEAVYRDVGCNVVRVQHPFLSALSSPCSHGESIGPTESLLSKILLLPGSRKSQALRNLPIYLKTVRDLQNVDARNIVVIAAREELVPIFEKFGVQVVVAPQDAKERMALFQSADFAITAPGTATLELALSGVSFTVCTKPDMLTYCLGKLFIKTKYFALPNIILDRLVFLEYIVAPWGNAQWIVSSPSTSTSAGSVYHSGTMVRDGVSVELRQKLAVGKTLEELALEFLGKLVESEPQ